MHNRDVLAPPPEVIARAAAWLVRMQEGKLTTEAELQLQAWRLENTEHERAWRAAMQLQEMMASVPGGLSQPVLSRQRLDRRQLLSIALLAAALPVTWTAYRQLPALTADYRTAKGEQRHLTLPDGSQLQLNTGSLVDVQFDAQQRLIRLHRGEIAIQTAPDNLTDNAINNLAHKRPFIVVTPVGNIRALGTRFAVRTLDADITQVEVYEHAVALKPAGIGIETRLDAGKKALFERKKNSLYGRSSPNRSGLGEWPDHCRQSTSGRFYCGFGALSFRCVALRPGGCRSAYFRRIPTQKSPTSFDCCCGYFAYPSFTHHRLLDHDYVAVKNIFIFCAYRCPLFISRPA